MSEFTLFAYSVYLQQFAKALRDAERDERDHILVSGELADMASAQLDAIAARMRSGY